jgi:hypothetical protein
MFHFNTSVVEVAQAFPPVTLIQSFNIGKIARLQSDAATAKYFLDGL